MARPARQTVQFRTLIAKLAPDLRKAFSAGVADLGDRVDMKALVEALKRNDIDGAIAAMHITEGAFYQYAATKTAAYAQGGALAATTINGPPGGGVAFRFDMANPRAQEWIAANVADYVTRLTDEAKEVLRAAILEGYTAGRHPNNIAVEIAGRMQGGKRVGGLVGLSGGVGPDGKLTGQVAHVASMRARLASGDPAEMAKVFGMTRRDKRFDSAIRKAIEAGKPVSAADIERMTQRYTDRLIAKRAEDIARTETGMAVMSSRAESWDQAAETLGYDASAVIKRWVHGGGVKDPRPHHVAANGMIVEGLDTPFILENGAVMQYALDPSGGPAECANCTCDTTFRMDHSKGVK